MLIVNNTVQQHQISGSGDSASALATNGNALSNVENKSQQPKNKNNKPPSGGRRNDSKYNNKEPLVNGTSA